MHSLSYYGQLFRQVLSNMRANLMRTILTCIGIIIGIASVIALWTQSTIAEEKQMKSYVDLGFLTPMISINYSGIRSGLSEADRDFILKQPNVKGASLEIELGQTTIFHGEKRKDKVSIHGYTSDYFGVNPTTTIIEGRGITERDEEYGQYVCLVDPNIAGKLFGGESPIGEKLLIFGIQFKVVGVMKNAVDAVSYSNQKKCNIYIPYSIAKRITGNLYAERMEIFPVDPVYGEDPLQNTSEYFDEIFPSTNKDYPAYYADSPIEQIRDVVEKMADQRRQQATTAAISLLVGGIGIMNMMLVSVTERTKEIGLRKALGATPSMIQQQFLLEAVILSLTGGLLGVAIGCGASAVVCIMYKHSFIVQYSSIFIGLGFSMLVGIVFGFLPARAASNMNPIDALRSD